MSELYRIRAHIEYNIGPISGKDSVLCWSDNSDEEIKERFIRYLEEKMKKKLFGIIERMVISERERVVEKK